jgi:hypothetical protein
LNLSALGLTELFVRGAGYSIFFEGEMGDAADDGAVFSDRRDRESSLPEDREEDIDPAFCPTVARI